MYSVPPIKIPIKCNIMIEYIEENISFAVSQNAQFTFATFLIVLSPRNFPYDSDFVFLMTIWFIYWARTICWKKYIQSNHFNTLTRKWLPSTMRELSFKSLQSIINVLYIIDIIRSQDWDQPLSTELYFCTETLEKKVPLPLFIRQIISMGNTATGCVFLWST